MLVERVAKLSPQHSQLEQNVLKVSKRGEDADTFDAFGGLGRTINMQGFCEYVSIGGGRNAPHLIQVLILPIFLTRRTQNEI